MKFAVSMLAGLVLSGFASVAFACSPVYPKWDKRAKVAKDCSFKNAGSNDWMSGDAPSDFGRGRLGQIIVNTFTTELVIADCNSLEAVSIRPPATGEQGVCSPVVDLSRILPPKADYTKRAKMQEIVSDAQSQSIYVEPNFLAYLKNFRRRDRFDPFCGCKLFYPESAGAFQ